MDAVKVCVACMVPQQFLTVGQDLVNSVLLNPDLAPLLAVVKSARNGAVYGAKVRFPHALV